MDLRVVVYGRQAVSYFRVGGGRFYNNVCRGGLLDHERRPDLQQRGIDAVRAFCERTAIDVAGFDLMFPESGEPVFIEINFHFGRKGLGGTPGHRRFWARAVEQWREACLETIRNGSAPQHHKMHGT
jgi:ribosomal protein S6--L-glutamate ligase